MKVYIAGPINGYLDNNERAFRRVAKELVALGYEPVNPLDVQPLADPHICRGEKAQGNHSYGCYMIPDLKALLDCEGYTLLRGWENSKGASVEEQVARICGHIYINTGHVWDDEIGS